VGVDIITVGKRSIYNPAYYQIKELYKNENWLVIDLMFTWDLPKAISELKQQRLKEYDRIFIDGVGWKNLGNDPVLDWDAIARTPYEQKEDYQVTKLSKGCPHNCLYCFSDDFETVNPPVPFNRNLVLLVDENIFDIRLLDLDKAFALKYARFIKPRIAWDGSAKDIGYGSGYGSTEADTEADTEVAVDTQTELRVEVVASMVLDMEAEMRRQVK